MKTVKLAAIFLFIPIAFYGQTLTGLWVGTVSNDSNTLRKDQSFEIVLTQYREKVFGYSRSTFIVNDTLYYIVKRVKGTIDGDICEVKDDDIISYNFKGKLDKGVKMISTFRFDHKDSAWHMDGTWKTNRTKKFYSVSGKMNLKTEPDIENSKIIPHLEELNLASETAVYVEAKKKKEAAPVVARSPAPDPSRREQRSNPSAARQGSGAIQTGRPAKTENQADAGAQASRDAIAKNDRPAPSSATQKTRGEQGDASTSDKTTVPEVPVESQPKQTAPVAKEPVAARSTSNPVAELKSPGQPALSTQTTKQEERKTETLANKSPAIQANQKAPVKENAAVVQASKETAASQTNTVAISRNPPVTSSTAAAQPGKTTQAAATQTNSEAISRNPPVNSSTVATQPGKTTPVESRPLVASPEPKPVLHGASFARERKLTSSQTVWFTSDSLQLALYDNGEVDGDTVSVLINGELVMARQGLKTTAIRKTIYTSAHADSITMVLYAENLGKYPPNTGLLVVRDGDQVYQVRFSADLQQNAAVIFRRKK